MDKLDEMIEMLENCMYAQTELGHDKIDTDEFYKVADIYKDLVHAKYELTVICAMDEKIEEVRKMVVNKSII